jgi:hypothetical protein
MHKFSKKSYIKKMFYRSLLKMWLVEFSLKHGEWKFLEDVVSGSL